MIASLCAPKTIAELRVGDLVDLEGDKFADPNRDHPAFESEYQTVAYIERETADCIAVGFEGFDVVGFPPDHVVMVNPMPVKPPCKFCDSFRPAQYVAAQSGDQGKTVEWVFACDDHAAGWNDGSDWPAPVFHIGEAKAE